MHLNNLATSFAPCAGEPLNFHLAADSNMLLRPFYQFREGEPYFVYLDPEMANRMPLWAFTYNGPWLDASVSRFTVTAGATAECAFEGTGVRFHGYQFTAAKSPGSAEVSIDGQPVGVIDETGPSDDHPFTWEHAGLAPGKHTIRFTTRSSQAFCIAGLEVMRGKN